MLEENVITFSVPIDGVASSTLISTTTEFRIVGVHMQQENIQSTTELLCGSDVVALNFGKDLGFIEMNFKCSEDLVINKTGQDESFTVVNVIFSSEDGSLLFRNDVVDGFYSVGLGIALLVAFFVTMLVLKFYE